MKYTVKANEASSREGSSIRGFATVVFGGSFKITNIAILENRNKGELFVSMPRYRCNGSGGEGSVEYKDVCNPIKAEFREELYTAVLNAYQRGVPQEKDKTYGPKEVQEMPDFTVSVTPYEREGSNIRGLARIYFEDCFLVNSVSIIQGREKLFVSMPSYKTSQVDGQGKAVYRDICYPVTREFREKLYDGIIAAYEKAKNREREVAKEREGKYQGSPGPEWDREEMPFR
jgi:DNA-binding cell septation regulator SpoVG